MYAKSSNCNNTRRIQISKSKLEELLLRNGKFLHDYEEFSPGEYCINRLAIKLFDLSQEVVLSLRVKEMKPLYNFGTHKQYSGLCFL